MPTFCAMTPERIGSYLPYSGRADRPQRPRVSSELDLDVDARGEIELHQRIDRLRGWIDDVEEPLVRTHLELLAALLVDVRRAVHRELLDAGRQRDRAPHLCAGPLRGVDDLARRSI